MSLGYTSRALTDGETLGFLFRHPTIAARIEEFTTIVNQVGYDQAPKPPGGWNPLDYDVLDYWLNQLPGWIPAWGLRVDDSVLGPVTIFPDAVGNLHYTAGDSPAGDINKPPYQSPSDASPLGELMSLAVVVAIGWGVYMLYRAAE